MKKPLYLLFLFLLVIIASCSNGETSNKDWKYAFVVWEGYNYIISDEKVRESDIEKKVGEIQTYLDNETNVNKNKTFSNKFKRGTLLYSIKEVDQHDSLAVKTDNGYVKINSNGKYKE
ncbi:hypothetical protein [Heyndrickxia vini]|uniref:Lipoprotein n=1 Tax=Heyndrickxia vini TaxID=1476025 RepID=A0ABX7E0R4_9BACI|nr:hypothetical protein [Heyndrickxia vini]QQZ09309.1 hypothetical protein I5776_20495 [Heyndrickxia vini]